MKTMVEKKKGINEEDFKFKSYLNRELEKYKKKSNTENLNENVQVLLKNLLMNLNEQRGLISEKAIKDLMKNRNEIAHSTKTLPDAIKLIKIDINVWNKLKELKKENQTFNDVIKSLIGEKTISIGNDDLRVIKYKRKIGFISEPFFGLDIGCEFEYNEVKENKKEFTLDLKLKKIFFKKKIHTVTEFFGVDNAHLHYSFYFMIIYFEAIALAIHKEFRINFHNETSKQYRLNYNFYEALENLVFWKKFYYDHQLSEESFINDIETPLRLSEEEKPSEEWQKRIENSVIEKILWENK